MTEIHGKAYVLSAAAQITRKQSAPQYDRAKQDLFRKIRAETQAQGYTLSYYDEIESHIAAQLAGHDGSMAKLEEDLRYEIWVAAIYSRPDLTASEKKAMKQDAYNAYLQKMVDAGVYVEQTPEMKMAMLTEKRDRLLSELAVIDCELGV